MANSVPTWLRGLIVPDVRTFGNPADAAYPSYEEGSTPGVPEAQVETEMVLEAVGDMPLNEVTVTTLRAGHPGVDASRFTFEYAHKIYGHDPPSSIADFEFVDASTVGDKWHSPHAIRLADRGIAVAAVKDLRYVK